MANGKWLRTLPAKQAFLCGLGEKKEEQGSKTARKIVQVKERGGGGEERKETLADKPIDFENRPLGLSCLSSRTDI